MTSILSGLPFQAQSGDRLVSKVVGAAIAALFKQSETLNATVRADPVAKLLQGSIDGFELLASGLLMYNGLRLENLELYSQAVAIDFSEIFQGRVKLRQPTQATMRVVLTEQDLATSFNTPFVLGKLKLLQINGQPLSLRQVGVAISNDGSLHIQAEAQMDPAGEWIGIDFSTQVEVEDRHRIQFVQTTYQGDPASVALSQSLVEHVNSLLDLDKFALDGTRLRVDRIRIRDHKIVFYGSAQIDRFPTRKAVH
ncbi:MAG: DUF2993 domain-containing protein [Cyanobacteriota bacterium]|nr:DUF2993 domain-containing protein [Cyanobacteriota bacterium]